MKRKWERNQVGSLRYYCEAEFPTRFKLLRWVGRQAWLPKGQDRLLRAIHHPDYGDHFLFEIDFFGQKYRGDLASYIDWMVFCYGSYSLPELKVLEAMLPQVRAKRSGPINFVDVGANAGQHTLFMASLADQVLAIEPLPELQALIQEKIAINALTNVRVAPVALGENNEIRDYYPGEGSNSGVGTFLPLSKESKFPPVKLEIRNGDEFLDEIKFGRIDLMKVDVEGFEPYVFRGLQRRIARDRPIILTEMSDESRRGFGSEMAFREAFYKGAHFAEIGGRSGRSFKLHPFVYETSHEVIIVPPEMSSFINI